MLEERKRRMQKELLDQSNLANQIDLLQVNTKERLSPLARQGHQGANFGRNGNNHRHSTREDPAETLDQPNLSQTEQNIQTSA